jgi:hypothetical protein
LRRARRRHYLREGDWVDSLYKAYVTVIVAAVALFYATAALGGSRTTGRAIADIVHGGAAVLGLGIAVLVTLGLRSGARGGPLAPEPADVVHLLLAPVPRSTILRAAALRQLRGVVLVPAVAGAVAGNVAAGRLGGDRVEWLAAGAAFGVLTALLVWGSALVASGTHLRIRAANAIGIVLVGWSAIDVAASTTSAPTAQVGRVALLPLTTSPLAFLGTLIALGVAGYGLAVAGRVSLEALRHRARLVGELRFAATLQDMRSVIVLHRELAQELPRSRPWIRAGSNRGSACWQRDWRGFARWPAGRALRVIVLAFVVGLACAGAWNGTEALVVLAGVAAFLMGVDAVEGLAQESDHPVRPEQYPIRWGDLVVSHLVAPATLLTGVSLIAMLLFGVLSGATEAFAVGAVALVPVAFSAVAGGAVSVVLGAPPPTLFLDLGFPEFSTLWLILRQVLAPLIVVAAFVPVAAAHAATGADSAVTAALIAALLPVVLVMAAWSWLRSREHVLR